MAGRNGRLLVIQSKRAPDLNPFLRNLAQHKYAPLAAQVIRIGLGLLFIYASLDKIWSPGLFAKAISNYRILPLPLLHISAIILPWLELVCGFALITNKYSRAANALIAGMLMVFILAILSAMFRGLDFNCGCFNLDVEESNMGLTKIVQNLGLLLCTAYLELNSRMSTKD